MRKLVETIGIQIRVMVAKKKWWVDPMETLNMEGFRDQLFNRVAVFLSDKAKELNSVGPKIFPVWDGYRQDFGLIYAKTGSVDGESAHNWYGLDDFELGWFLTPEGELNVYVRRGKDTVEKYTYRSR
ncbi:hypothetical protein [Shimazuella kribbensis]|uniref:hypothetical protein n=1 Tax=Shimazuella kribbensis TaxID=139808 RepID=UPI0003FA704B|nr:hypothetical protein [Shimazuella kribbensis]